MVRNVILALILGCGLAFASVGGETVADARVDRLAPGFVQASLLVCGPCDTLYGCVGHIAIRLKCPHYQLDEVFSFEGEPVRHQVLRFLAGRLKMALLTSSFADFQKECREQGRGLRQYELALSPAAKVRLWKLLDDRVAEGANRPYDYVRHGCAQSTFRELLAAIAPDSVTFTESLPHAGETRRDILESTLTEFPWTRLLINLISGPEADRMVAATDVVIMPEDLVEALGRLRVKGEPILVGDPVELLLQARCVSGRGWIPGPTTCVIALLLVAIVGCFRFRRPIFALLLTLQVALAIFVTYVSVFSSLPAAAWNVALIPFNPLPFVFWRWRRWWSRPFAVVLAVWSVVMLLAPHRLTDPAMVVLVLAYAVLYGRGKFLV